MKQQAPSYIRQLETELQRLGAEREQTRQVMAEVWAHVIRLPDDDPAEAFGPAEQFAHDVLAGRRPVRTRYLQQLSLELSRRGVPGQRAGQVLAEVDEHVTDSGEDPATAFGPPDEYAAQIAATTGLPIPEWRQPSSRALLIQLLSVTGTLLTAEGIAALVQHHPASLTLGLLAAAIGIPLWLEGSMLLVRRAELSGCLAVLVAMVGGLVAMAGGLVAQVAALVWFRGPELGSFPAWTAAALGLALLAVSLRLSWTLVHSRLPEPVTDPRPGDHAVDDTVWDLDNHENLARRVGWGAPVSAAMELAVVTAAVLLLR